MRERSLRFSFSVNLVNIGVSIRGDPTGARPHSRVFDGMATVRESGFRASPGPAEETLDDRSSLRPFVLGKHEVSASPRAVASDGWLARGARSWPRQKTI